MQGSSGREEEAVATTLEEVATVAEAMFQCRIMYFIIVEKTSTSFLHIRSFAFEHMLLSCKAR